MLEIAAGIHPSLRVTALSAISGESAACWHDVAPDATVEALDLTALARDDTKTRLFARGKTLTDQDQLRDFADEEGHVPITFIRLPYLRSNKFIVRGYAATGTVGTAWKLPPMEFVAIDPTEGGKCLFRHIFPQILKQLSATPGTLQAHLAKKLAMDLTSRIGRRDVKEFMRCEHDSEVGGVRYIAARALRFVFWYDDDEEGFCLRNPTRWVCIEDPTDEEIRHTWERIRVKLAVTCA